MPSNSGNENSFRKVDQIVGYDTTNTPTAITWEEEQSTTLTLTDVIIGTVYITETGTTNGLDYSITVQGVEIASGSVAAGANAAIKVSGYIGSELQVLLESTLDDNSAEATVKFFGK